jgi:hypothetical protein
MRLMMILRDLIGAAGVGCVTYSAYLYSAQAAFLVGGVFLILIALLTALGDQR